MKRISAVLLMTVLLCGKAFSQNVMSDTLVRHISVAVDDAPNADLPPLMQLLPKTLVIVDTTAYSVEDFLWYYNKTLREHNVQMYPSDYISYYVDLKKKVAEAEQMQLDTTRAFREEFFQHLRRTAHNRMYQGADEKLDEMVKTEYDRLHWDYEVAHIFIKSNIYDSPSAKRAAEEKINAIRREIYDAATLPDYTFKKCVQEYSDDNLSKEYDGNVGFITAMVSPYEYEEAVYNTNVGNMVTVRTAEGWYLILVLQKRPTKGAVDAAIIMIYPQTDDEQGWLEAKSTIDTVYAQLQQGVPFDTLSNRYNLNPQLRETKGVLGLIDNGMPYSRELKETLFDLENDGDFSAPIKLPYGYAIMKRRWALPLQSFEFYKDNFKERIEADRTRNSVIENEYLENMKQYLSYKPYPEKLEWCLQFVDASILLGKWTAPVVEDVTLFELNGEKYGARDFFDYLQAIQKNRLNDVYDKDMLVRIRFDNYVKRRVELAKMKNMEQNDKEFQYIMQEYHDGMIVYELMNREVFRYAEEDTVGMKFYYNQHKEQYMTEPRRESVTFTCDDEKTVAKVMKLLNQQDLWYNGAKVKDADKIAYYEQKGTPQMYIINTIASKNPNAVSVDVQDKVLRHPEDVLMTVTLVTLEDDEGKTAYAKELKGISDKILVENNTITVTYYYFGSRQQTIKEAKEQLLMDYRKEIETQWMKSLSKRHSAEIDQPLLEKLDAYYKDLVEQNRE